MRAWELVSEVPEVANLWAYICLVLNILIPGTGTMVASCVGKENFADKTQMIVGIFQLLTSIYIIGWIWSICWGVMIVKNSKGGHLEVKRLMGDTNAQPIDGV